MPNDCPYCGGLADDGTVQEIGSSEVDTTLFNCGNCGETWYFEEEDENEERPILSSDES